MARAAFLGKKAEVSKELDGLEIGVNQFGVISSNLSVEEMNAFLNKNVFDKKLKNNLSSEMSGDYDSLDEDFDDDDCVVQVSSCLRQPLAEDYITVGIDDAFEVYLSIDETIELAAEMIKAAHYKVGSNE